VVVVGPDRLEARPVGSSDLEVRALHPEAEGVGWGLEECGRLRRVGCSAAGTCWGSLEEGACRVGILEVLGIGIDVRCCYPWEDPDRDRRNVAVLDDLGGAERGTQAVDDLFRAARVVGSVARCEKRVAALTAVEANASYGCQKSQAVVVAAYSDELQGFLLDLDLDPDALFVGTSGLGRIPVVVQKDRAAVSLGLEPVPLVVDRGKAENCPVRAVEQLETAACSRSLSVSNSIRTHYPCSEPESWSCAVLREATVCSGLLGSKRFEEVLVDRGI